MAEKVRYIHQLASSSRGSRYEQKPSQFRYIDCRFETDMKVLLGKFDRMEVLMEQLIVTISNYMIKDEAVERPRKRSRYTDDPRLMYDEEEIISEELEQPMIETEEEEVMEELEEEMVEQDQIYDLPLRTMEDLEEFDGIMATDNVARNQMISYFENFVALENTFKDVVRKIVSDEVLLEYSEQKGDLRNLYTFSLVLKDAYSKQKDAKNYWRRIDSLFFPISQSIKPAVVVDFNFPLQNTKEIYCLDEKIKNDPGLREQLTEVMQSIYLKSDRNNTNFLQKLIGQVAIEECGWSQNTKKPHSITDYMIFNAIFPEIIGTDSKRELEEIYKMSMNQLRHRFYSQKHRRLQKQKQRVETNEN